MGVCTTQPWDNPSSQYSGCPTSCDLQASHYQNHDNSTTGNQGIFHTLEMPLDRFSANLETVISKNVDMFKSSLRERTSAGTMIVFE
jgi:hypothetical protein